MLDRSRLLKDVHVEIPVAVWRQYLRDRSGPGLLSDPPPVASIAERGLYQIDVDRNGQAALTAAIRVRVFDPSTCRNLPVLSGGRTWRAITVNGADAKLATHEGWLRFSPNRPGVYDIVAQSPLPGAKTGRTNTLQLPVRSTVQTLVGFDSPAAWEVTAAGAAIKLSGQADTGTGGQLALTAQKRLDVTYGPVQVQRERPAQFRLFGHVAWNLDAGRQQVTARVRVRILGGKADRLVLTLPADADHVTLTGPDVRETQIRGRQATVFLRGKIAEQTVLDLQYERPAGRGHIKRIEGPAIEGGFWVGGTLTVTHTLGGSEILPESARDLAAQDLTQIAPQAAALLVGPPAVTYRITGRGFAAAVEVLDLGEFALRESLVDLAHYEVALTRDGAMICKARYEIRNRNRQFLRLSLPAGAIVLQATVNEQPRPLTAVAATADNADDYLLPLVRSKASIKGLVSFPAEIVYVHKTPALARRGELALPLPQVDLPLAYAWSELYAPRALQVDHWAGPLRPVDIYSNETAVAQLGYGAGQLAEGFTTVERMTPGQGLGIPTDPSKAEVIGWEPLVTEGSAAIRPVVGWPGQAKLNRDLAANYWRTGKDHYDRGEYDQAAEALANVAELAPGSVEAGNAGRLLSNIDVVTGQADLTERSERVAGAKVRTKIAADNRKLLEKQQGHLEQAAQAAQEGRYKDAQVQYQAAEALGDELVARGEDADRQAVVLTKGKADVAGAQEHLKGQAQTLRKRYATLRAEGKYDLAQQQLRQLRGLGTEDDDEITEEMEELALLYAKVRILDSTEAWPDPQFVSPPELATGTGVVAGARKRLQPSPARKIPVSVGSGIGTQTSAEIDLPEVAVREPDRDGGEDAVRRRALARLERQRRLSVQSTRSDFDEAMTRARRGYAFCLREGVTQSHFNEARVHLTYARNALSKGAASLPVDEVNARQQEHQALFALVNTRHAEWLSQRTESTRSELAQWERRRTTGGDIYEADPFSYRRPSTSPAPPERRELADKYVINGHGRTDGYGLPRQARTRQVGGDISGVTQQRDGRITILEARARDLIRDFRYDEALSVIQELSKLDPNNAFANDQRNMLEQFVTPQKQKPLAEATLREQGRMLLDIRESDAPWNELLAYPEDWRELSHRRREQFARDKAFGTDEDRLAYLSLKKRVGELVVKDVAFADIIQYLRDATGAGIHVKWNVLSTAGVHKNTPVSLNLPDRTLHQVLRLLLEDLGDVEPLSFTVGDGVITISTTDDLKTRTIVRVYDIQDLIIRVPDFVGPRVDVAEAAIEKGDRKAEDELTHEEALDELTEAIESNVDPESWQSLAASIEEQRGALIIRQTPGGHEAVEALLDQLREARGPQVQRGGRIARQQAGRAAGPTRGLFRRRVQTRAAFIPLRHEGEAEANAFKEFVRRNYAWQRAWNDSAAIEADVGRRADFNLGQKVPVASVNIAAPARNAQVLGVQFKQGNNNVHYAVVDEAIVSTLRQQAAAAGAIGFAPNPTRQEAIVGTEALLSNDLTANVAYAQDAGNRLDILGNPVDVPHEKYVLIDNDGSLTAIRAGAMQHWADPTEFEPLAEIPQTIDIPRVGRMIKFEKTLVDPADRLVLRASYRLNTDR